MALPAVGVSGGGVAEVEMPGQAVLLSEWPAYRHAVAVYVGLVLGAAVVGAQFPYPAGQASDGCEVVALRSGGVAVGLGGC